MPHLDLLQNLISYFIKSTGAVLEIKVLTKYWLYFLVPVTNGGYYVSKLAFGLLPRL